MSKRENIKDWCINLLILLETLLRLVILPFKLLYRFTNDHHMIVAAVILASCVVELVGLDYPGVVDSQIMYAAFIVAIIGCLGVIMVLLKPSVAPELAHVDHKAVSPDHYQPWDS